MIQLPSLSAYRRLRTALVAAAAIVAAFAHVPAASAGTYRVFACQLADGRPVSLGDWIPESEAIGSGPDECARQGLYYAQLGLQQAATTWWTGLGITMPAGSGLRAMSIRGDRWVRQDGDHSADYKAAPTYQLRAGIDRRWFEAGVNVVESCSQFDGCPGYAWGGGAASRFSYDLGPTGSTFVGLANACIGEPDGACRPAAGGRTHLRVNQLDLTVADNVAPTVSSASGSILRAGARAGTESLTYAASDTGAGILEGIVRVDGVEVGRSRPAASPTCTDAGGLAAVELEYTRLQPCAANAGVSFDVDTRRLANGPHRLTALVRDAAGNVSNEISTDITVDNPVVAAPLPNDPNGGGGQRSTARLGLKGERKTLTATFAKKATVTGRLEDAAKAPITGAAIDVFEQIDLPSAPWTKVGVVTTDAKGKYRYQPSTRSSRSLRFSYAPLTNSTDYRAERVVAVRVRAGLTITAAPRSVRARGLISLAGKVRIDGIPEKGTFIEVQAVVNGSWRTIATRRVSRKGSWSFRHRLTSARNATLAFRSRLRPASDLAAAESTSRTVRVRVR